MVVSLGWMAVVLLAIANAIAKAIASDITVSDIKHWIKELFCVFYHCNGTRCLPGTYNPVPNPGVGNWITWYPSHLHLSGVI